MSCYSGDNPVKTLEEGVAIWKWAKEFGGIDEGAPIEKVHDNINQYFFGGQAKPEWITDILSGRKTPLRSVANDLWRKQYNRRAVIQQAEMMHKLATLGPVGKAAMALRYLPRSVTVAGHGIVFALQPTGA